MGIEIDITATGFPFLVITINTAELIFPFVKDHYQDGS